MRDGFYNPDGLTPDDVFGMERPERQPDEREDDGFDWNWPEVDEFFDSWLY